MARRVYANGPEEGLAALAEANGWRPCKRGWPDFLCFGPDGEVIAVEVKPRLPSGRMKLLRRDQAICMDFLSSKGVRCFVSDGKALEPYDREKHASEERRRESAAKRRAIICGVRVEAA